MLYSIFIIMLVTGIACFVLSIVLLFVFRVPDLIDELSGNKAKRQIKRLREMNSGTGSLDGIATNDVYSVIGSGNLTKDEDVFTNVQDSEESSGVITMEVRREVQRETSEQDELATGILGSNDDEDEVPTSYTDTESDDEGATNIMSESEDEEGATSFVEDECVTGILTDVKSFISDRRMVEVIKEQTSIKEDVV